MAKEKMEFKIQLREIGNGFLVSLETKHGTLWEEKFCEDREAIIGQMRTWIDTVFDNREKE